MKSVNEILREENRIMREGLQQILLYPNVYAYASASSHPDTNRAYQHILDARRALNAADNVSRDVAGGTE